MSISILSLRNYPLFQNDLILVAGFGGLENQISYVTIIDSPLIPAPAYNLRDQVFVLTSFCLYKDSPEQMLQAVKNLAENGISALGVKSDLYIGTIPQCVKDYCNTANLPLFELCNKSIPFRRVISTVEGAIKYSETQDNDGNLLGNILHSDLKSVFNQMAQELQVNVVCVTVNQDIVVKYVPLETPPISLLLQKASEFLTKAEEDGMGFHNLDFSAGYIRQEEIYVFPCFVFDNLEAILLFEDFTPLYPDKVQKIKKLTALLSLQIRENVLLERSRQSLAAKRTAEILLGDYPDEKSARLKFGLLGFADDAFYRLVVLSSPDLDEAHTSYFIIQKLWDELTQKASQWFSKCLPFRAPPYLVLLVPVIEGSKYSDDARFEKALEEFVESSIACKALFANFSQMQGQLSQVSGVYAHLFQAARSRPYMPYDVLSNVMLTRDFDMLSLVSALVSTNQHHLLYDAVIAPISEYDKKYNSNIWGTLSECMRSNSLEEAASNLHIHSSTLRYRLQKAFELTGYNYFNLQGRTVIYSAYLLSTF